LLVDGVINGTGAVFAFLPQILIPSLFSPCWRIAATWHDRRSSWIALWSVWA
jgi:hypothetical protein